MGRHRLATAVLALIIVGLGYYGFRSGTAGSTQTRYVLATVSRGTLATSVSGTGQVSAVTQVDVKPKASGQVISLPAREGQWLYKGGLIAQIDSTNAQKAVRDAEVSLESAQITLDKLKQSSADINQIIEDSFADISAAFLDFPSIVTSADDIILGSTIKPGQQDNVGFYKDFVGQSDNANYQKDILLIESARNYYAVARVDYEKALVTYKQTTRASTPADVQRLLDQTVAATKTLAVALQAEQNLLAFLVDYATAPTTVNRTTLPVLVTSYQTNIRTHIGLVNNHLSALTAARNSIANAPLDIRAQELTVKARQNALLDAQTTLGDYSIRTPMAGVVANIPINVGDEISGGTIAATMISASRIVMVSLNEVDVAKVAVGQKASLTFDAVPGLTLTGSVTELDTIGTQTQGVVNYTVKVSFDSQDERIKPGMTVTAAIITESRNNILVVPASAVKSRGSEYYVETLPGVSADNSRGGITSAALPARVPVQVGLTNDTMTEIIGGLTEGDIIISRTIAATAAAPAPSQSSIFGGGGGLRVNTGGTRSTGTGR